MVQDIEKTFSNRYLPGVEARPEDFLVCFRDNAALLAQRDGEIVFPTAGEAGCAGAYLFTVGDRRYFLGDAEPFGDFGYQEIALLRRSAPRETVFAGVTALHLYRWYRDNRFCGRCGKPMRHSVTERAMVCDCGNTVYPAIAPAVIVGVIDGDKICLTKYNRGYANWALVAGYTEIGETPEQTVAREVREETGLAVKNIVYYKSQPWGLSGSLLLGFFCEVDGSNDITVDRSELKEACWFAPEEIDFPDDRFSLTREMIARFRSGAWREAPTK